MRSIRSLSRVPAVLLAPLAAGRVLIALPACAQGDAAIQAAAAAGNDGRRRDRRRDDHHVRARGRRRRQPAAGRPAAPAVPAPGEQNRFDALNATLQEMVREEMLQKEAAAAGQSVDEYLRRRARRQGSARSPTTTCRPSSTRTRRVSATARWSRSARRSAPTSSSRRSSRPRRASTTSSSREYDVAVQLEPPRVDVAAAGARPRDRPTRRSPSSSSPTSSARSAAAWCRPSSRSRRTTATRCASSSASSRSACTRTRQKAAEASLCAHEQGKFWEMHDAMFANQQALAVDAAQGDGGEPRPRRRPVQPVPRLRQVRTTRWQADMQAGAEAGVSGTPAMFVNGRMVAGAVPYDQIAAVIDDELERKGVAMTPAATAPSDPPERLKRLRPCIEAPARIRARRAFLRSAPGRRSDGGGRGRRRYDRRHGRCEGRPGRHDGPAHARRPALGGGARRRLSRRRRRRLPRAAAGRAGGGAGRPGGVAARPRASRWRRSSTTTSG